MLSILWSGRWQKHLSSSALRPFHIGSSSPWGWQSGGATHHGVFSSAQISHCMSRTLPGVGNRKRAKRESRSWLIWRWAHLGENLWYKCVQHRVGRGATHSKFKCTGNLLQLGTVLFIHYQAYHTLEVRSWDWVGLFHCSLCVQVIQKSCLLFPYVNCA